MNGFIGIAFKIELNEDGAKDYQVLLAFYHSTFADEAEKSLSKLGELELFIREDKHTGLIAFTINGNNEAYGFYTDKQLSEIIGLADFLDDNPKNFKLAPVWVLGSEPRQSYAKPLD